jgi:hypothetical protein
LKIVAGQGVFGEFQMVEVSTHVLAINASFHVGTSALTTTILNSPDTP